MSRELSAEEAKLECVAQMGEPLGLLYNALWQDVAWLHHKWADYVALFGTKPSRIELMNKAAPSFFHILDGVLWEDTLLHIARLTDRPQSGRNRYNCSIQSLAPLINDRGASDRVAELTVEAVSAAGFCRDWRNRRIAHRDLDHALGRTAEPLAEVSRLEVKQSLEAIVEVLNAVSLHYSGSTTMFEGWGEPGGAESLLHVLDAGVRAQAERFERFRRGEVPVDESLHPDV